MKNFLKKLLIWTLIFTMVISTPVEIFAQVTKENFNNDLVKVSNYEDLSQDKSKIINELKPIKPAKPGDGQSAVDLIKNPKQPEIYTLRTDYKVQRGEKYEVGYQPYIASVGEAASEEEKAKINKVITLPELAGYDKSHLDDTFTNSYEEIVEAAKKGLKIGDEISGIRYEEEQYFKYKAKANKIIVKHVFQDLEDFAKYTNPDGTITHSDGTNGTLINKGGTNPVEVDENEVKKHELRTIQNGNTGSTMEVTPIDQVERKGFVPEAPFIAMQVPENAENFILEYRYNRDHFDVNFDTDGGTELPNRTLYYGQTIPKLDFNITKPGSNFLGWKVNKDINYTDSDGNEQTLNKDTLIIKEDFEAGGKFESGIKNAMPAESLTFTAQWTENKTADYVIQFWTEKTDYDDKNETLSLRDRYDFIGARRIDDADTGSTPDLTNLDIHGITFPDLNDGRLEKAQDNKEEFERYYFLNEGLTKKQNASEDNPEVQKSVSSTGETVYNVYYDRRVYTLYFTAPNEEGWDPSSSYWPTLTRNGQVIGTKGSPYKVEARFNQSLDKIWPKDEEISGLPPASSLEGVDMGPIGWTINVNEPGELIFRDTPPYRLSAEDFIDSEDVETLGNGHGDQIPIGENQTKARGKYEISLAASSWDESVVHHIDIIKDDFEGNEQIDYDLSYWKSDTNASYAFLLPNLQGFTLKEETRDAEWVLAEPTTPMYRTINDVNRARNEKTPFRSDADKIEYIAKFPWGTKLFDGKNRYNFANYSRNKYKLKLNNDPKTVKNDSEYGADNILEVPYEKPLNDLKLDATHKPEKPNWVRDDWSFLGWALDPAGDNLVKDGKETKLHYDQVLYAKWGEPDYKWKVIFDPNGGSLRTIDENKLTTERKTVTEGDIGQEKETTYPIKENSEGDKQVFKVVHKQKLVEPKFKPVRKGYDFMGWEIIRYKKNEQGEYTEQIDNSYRETYKVPELYSFGNDVVSPIYLKAIWVPNQKVDIDVLHYMLDDDYKLDSAIKPNPKKDKLEEKRANYLVATTGDRQNDEYILAPHDELEEKLEGNLKEIYEEYNDRVGLNNSFFQTFRVEPEKILNNETNKMEDNPKAENNVFKFFYRPFRKREYKVNYIDERFKDKENEKDGAIIGQEIVKNGNRYYDARNYRRIPGWVLTSDPQQQLFFDVNEETNELIGINGTGSDEITFYYKDVRVIEVPGDKEPPEGYVRVTYKIDEKDSGGAFVDKYGNEVTELHYDVIKGLKSDLLPDPELLGTKADGTPNDKEEGKYYITPDDGKKFVKWDNKPLLNKNTLVENSAENFYVFTAYFEWSGLTAKGLVRTEAYKDPEGKWTNNFAPTIADLNKQLVWRENDKVKDLPAGTIIEFFDEAGNKLTSDEQIFDLVNEKKAADKDELVRTVNIKVKATFTEGKDPQELVIPITVYKNVYEALNKEGDKPLFLKEAEEKEAKDGGLKDILKGNTENRYIKVTIKPNKDFTNKDDKVYYVNPNAWVEIPELKVEDTEAAGTGFINWTADQVKQNDDGKENGKFDFAKRHKFTEDTIITPVDAKDVVEQTDPNKKPDVPNGYVKVIVKTTDKATDDTKFEKTFWVNPTREVTIDVTNPTGKTVAADPIVGAVGYTMNFSKWETEDKAKTWTDKIVGKFENDTTILAKYSVKPEKVKDQVPTTDTVHTPQGKTPTADEIKDKITPPDGKTIKTVTIVENPDVDNPGESKVKVIVEYTDGSSVGTNDKPVEIPVEVHETIIPANPDGSKPEKALDNYVKVIFKAGEGGSLSGKLVYYVSPEVEVDMTESAGKVTKTPEVGYFVNGEQWTNKDSKTLQGKFTDEVTEFAFKFDKSDDIVEKIDENTKIPEGYVKVTFKTEDEAKGKLEGEKLEKIYYVNPKAGIKLGKAESEDNKTLVVPKTLPAENYEFDKWYEEIDTENSITSERIHVAKFRLVKVTLTYEAGEGATGDVPEEVKVDHGTSVRLAGQGNLTKENATFAGWKIDGKTYQAGEEVTLTKNTTATAVWNTAKHTVAFDTKGGSKVDSQQVEHGKTATEPTIKPTLDGKVFMGWKEKESDENYFDFETPITEDKTLIAIWQDPVQKINDGDTVEEQFIKVTFNEGAHGKLKLDDAEQTSPVIYKVAKDLTFDKAQQAGLEVPEIAPAKYYKAKAENDGWDKALNLTLASGETEKIFTAQYEPEADVIPIDPKVTPDEKLEDDKPEGMVLVTFKVSDDNNFYIPNNAKYYVKKDTEVRVPTPVVLEKTINAVFNGWKDVKLVNEPIDPNTTDPDPKTFQWVKQSFKEDTVISDEKTGEIKLIIKKPAVGDKRIYIEQMSDDSTGKLELIRDGKVIEIATSKTIMRRRKEYKVFDLTNVLQSGDTIRYWQEGSSRISDKTTEIIN